MKCMILGLAALMAFSTTDISPAEAQAAWRDGGGRESGRMRYWEEHRSYRRVSVRAFGASYTMAPQRGAWINVHVPQAFRPQLRAAPRAAPVMQYRRVCEVFVNFAVLTDGDDVTEIVRRLASNGCTPGYEDVRVRRMDE